MLSDDDMSWVATKIHEYRQDLLEHPRWRSRIEYAIDNLLWSPSVDASSPHEVIRDGWVRTGQELTGVHFQNVPHTAGARTAFLGGNRRAIRREHIVPRRKLLAIVGCTSTPDDTKRVLVAYARVALVHETERKRLKPAFDMPEGWDAAIEWTSLPAQLPSPWARYQYADPPVILLEHGRPLF